MNPPTAAAELVCLFVGLAPGVPPCSKRQPTVRRVHETWWHMFK